MSEKTPQFAGEARTFLAQNRYGMLSTISASQGGFPFGSIVPYDVAENGDLVIYVSLIAEHYKNLAVDPRASIVAANYFAYDDPQAFARATVLCKFEPVPESEQPAVQRSYEERFPSSVNYEIAHNFLFMRGAPERIRWIGGFGDIGWVNQERYRGAEPDPLARAAFDILQHMNEDHADALREYIRAFGTKPAEGGVVQMTEITASSFTVTHHAHGKATHTRIPFGESIVTPDGARTALIALLKTARAKR